MEGFLLDTHSVVSFLGDAPELSVEARLRVEEAISRGTPVFVSVITIIEMVYLSEKNRIPEEALMELKRTLLDPQLGIALIPVDFRISEMMGPIPRSLVPDMPDRIIAATALAYNLTLVTKDSRLRNAPIRTLW